ncbi:MAG: hypothetical protein ACK56I_26700, partial [bacterium]
GIAPYASLVERLVCRAQRLELRGVHGRKRRPRGCHGIALLLQLRRARNPLVQPLHRLRSLHELMLHRQPVGTPPCPLFRRRRRQARLIRAAHPVPPVLQSRSAGGVC